MLWQTNPINRRLFIKGSMTAGIVTLLAACGGSSSTSTTEATQSAAETATQSSAAPGGSPTSASAQATSAPSGSPAPSAASTASSNANKKRGGTVINTIDADPPTLNPDITSGATDGIVTSGVILEPLIRFDKDFKPMPYLAESWDVSDDGKQFTFHLRQGVKWHDGETFTADDVKFSWQEVIAKYEPQIGPAFQLITSIDTPDAQTVVVNFTDPYGPFLTAVADALVIPKHIFEGKDPLQDPHSLTEPIGTGPFTLKQWNRGQDLTLERFPNYWQEGKPYLDQIIFKEIPQASSRTAAIQAGEVDFLQQYYFDPADYPTIQKDSNLESQPNLGSTEMLSIILNTRNKPFDDKRVRQALMMAVDRAFICKAVFFDLAQPAKSAIPTAIKWANNPDVDLTTMYPFDTDKANQLLDDAGVTKGSNGTRFSLKLVFDPAHPGFTQFGQSVQQSWKDIGVDVKLTPLERQVMIQTVFMDWDFDGTIQSYASSSDPQTGIARLYISSSIGKKSFNNASGYSDPKIDDLFAKGAAQATQEKRAPFYFQAQEILAEDLPTLPIGMLHNVNVASTKFDFTSVWAQLNVYYGWEDVTEK